MKPHKPMDPSRILDKTHSFLLPLIEEAEAGATTNDERREAITLLVMSLSMGIALLGATYLSSEATSFGTHVGGYVTETMDRIRKESEKNGKPKRPEEATSKSAWD